MEYEFLNMQIIIKAYPDLFPPKNLQTEEAIRELFYWSYQYVITRCYGWNLPCTMLVPFADCFNHATNGVYHCLFHRKLEEIKVNEEDFKYNLKY